ncbi:MAG: hypothetical protein P4L87_11010, partial [Formivibrio sp.]|nr:hypothetical protein [Formivibrio sp.]
RLITLNNATSITPDSPTRARVGQCLYVGQNSMQISMPSGSVLRANQQPSLTGIDAWLPAQVFGVGSKNSVSKFHNNKKRHFMGSGVFAWWNFTTLINKKRL